MKLVVQTSTTDGLTLDAAVVLGLHLLRRMKSRANWDRHFVRRPETSVWSSDGKFQGRQVTITSTT